jgi:hypothetical protein
MHRSGQHSGGIIPEWEGKRASNRKKINIETKGTQIGRYAFRDPLRVSLASRKKDANMYCGLVG